MAAKVVFAIAAQVLLVQIAFGQTVQGPNSFSYGNIVNDNDYYYANNLALNLGGVTGAGSAVGLGGSALGLGGSAIGLGGSALGLGASGLALGAPGLAVGGYGNGLALGGYGNGLALGGYGNGLALGGAGLGYGNSGLVGSSFEGYGFVPDVSVSASLPVTGPYIGSGFGELAAGGDVAAYGTAVITGQLPALGVVAFNGAIPASGTVSIAGNCACAGIPL